jgi:hypothetical protein
MPCILSTSRGDVDRSNYTISITYTSAIDSDRPRSGLAASNTGGDPPSYAYSGQSFGACSYTACPIQADVESVYTYEFKTLKSVSRAGRIPCPPLNLVPSPHVADTEQPFDGLTYNVTDWIDGPSLFCAGFPIKFTG